MERSLTVQYLHYYGMFWSLSNTVQETWGKRQISESLFTLIGLHLYAVIDLVSNPVKADVRC